MHNKHGIRVQYIGKTDSRIADGLIGQKRITLVQNDDKHL